MRANLKKFRLSRKIVTILAGCIVLSGASAAFTVYFGNGMAFGPRQAAASGLACTTIQTVELYRNGQRWVRKFVRAPGTDGVARVRTALRIASVFSKAEQADLYQVVVIDENGPATRGAMRGRAIGADVLFTRRPGEVAGMDVPFKARYVEGPANATGLFSGERVELSLDDIKSAVLAMDDHSDCSEPSTEGKAQANGHGSPAAKGKGGAHPSNVPERDAHEPTMEDFAAGRSDAGHGRDVGTLRRPVEEKEPAEHGALRRAPADENIHVAMEPARH